MMYLHLGGDVLISYKEVVGIFDIEKTTTSKITRDFLKTAEQKEMVINVLTDIPKSFVVTDNEVYITQISPQTLFKRMEENKPSAIFDGDF